MWHFLLLTVFVIVVEENVVSVNAATCACTIDGSDYPKVTTYDNQTLHIKNIQTTQAATWHPHPAEQCSFRMRVETTNDGGQISLRKASMCIGILQHNNEMARCFVMSRDMVSMRGEGIIGSNHLVLPYSADIETGTPNMDVSVRIIQQNGTVYLTSSECTYNVQFKRAGENSAVQLSFDKASHHVISGMCGDCDGVQDDYRLCDQDRTNVVTDPDRYTLISDSCAL